MQKTAIKGLGFTLLFFPAFIFSQTIIHPPKKDYSDDFSHIQHGDLLYYLKDTVRIVFEKSCDRWIISDFTPDRAVKKFNRVTKGRELVYDKNSSEFAIYVWEGEILKHKITFGLDPKNSKINKIEISKEN
jgi:hypothetical protein